MKTKITKIERKVKITELSFCDICFPKEVRSKYRCELCNRDMCKKCTIMDYSEQGDYPNYHCKECTELISTYEKRIVPFQEEIDKIHEELECRSEKIRKAFKEKELKRILKLDKLFEPIRKSNTDEFIIKDALEDEPCLFDIDTSKDPVVTSLACNCPKCSPR